MVEAEVNVCTSLVVSVVFKLIWSVLGVACATNMLELGACGGEDALAGSIV